LHFRALIIIKRDYKCLQATVESTTGSLIVTALKEASKELLEVCLFHMLYKEANLYNL